jgi:CheY-like chemotaxis protein
LVVDDNRDAADSLAALLMLWGYDSLVRYGGAEAIAAAQTFRPELAVLDLNLPVLGGLEAAVQIRRFDPQMRLVALSADARSETLIETSGAGFDAHVRKPAEAAQLRALIERLLLDVRT